MMQGIGRKYFHYVNSLYRRNGTLLEGRFKSALIDSERYLLACCRYIEMNPVRANMVKSPGQYRWSGYHANALGQDDRCVTPHNLYRRLASNKAKRLEIYRALFKTHIDDESIDLIRENTQQCTIVGDSRFQEEIKKMLKRRVMKHKHGGDRKAEDYSKVSNVLTP